MAGSPSPAGGCAFSGPALTIVLAAGLADLGSGTSGCASPDADSEQLGVSGQTVISIERHRFDPSLPLAFRLAKVFDCRIEDVFQVDDSADLS
jgi:putative transcriptional regulator